jgi:alpha-L-arabinofuranosidase
MFFTWGSRIVHSTIADAQKVELSMDVFKTGAKIDRNIFGQFAEHLGHGVYEGIWAPRFTMPASPGPIF